MKSIKIAALAVCSVFVMAFASCSDDEDNTKSVKFNPSVASVLVGSTQKVLMTGGDGTYTAKSADEKIVSASVAKDTVLVKGVKAGTATILVTDSKKISGRLNVVVFDTLAISKTAMELATGKEGTVTVSGGITPYTVTSKNAKIATATLKNATITVKGVAEGSTVVTVTDKNNMTATMTVTVTK